MAFAASVVSIREGRVTQNSLMGGLPVGVSWVSPVTGLACDLPMVCLKEGRPDIDLFVRLRRSHLPRSAFTGRLRRFA